MKQTTNSPSDAYAVLRVRDFRIFLIARLLFTISIQMQAVVVGWQIYELTNDPLSLGLIGLAEAFPSIGISLYAGHVADIVERRKIILWGLGVLSFCSLALMGFTIPIGTILEDYGTFPIYFIIFLSGIARGFLGPSIFGFMTQIVDRKLYANSAAWTGTTFQLGSVAGPAIGGLSYAFFGITATYALDALLVILPLLMTFTISPRPLPTPAEKEKFMSSLMGGLRFVFRHETILSVMALDMFAVLFGGAVALLPIFAKEILDVGAMGLGFLRAAPSVGAVLLAAYLTYHPPLRNSGKTLLLVVLGFGISMIVFGLSTNFYLSLFVLFLSGAFDSVSVVIRSTIMQIMTPETMRGRVSAVNKIFVGSSNELGALESGVTAKFMGTVPSVLFGGFMTLFVVGFTWRAVPKLKNLHIEEHL